MRLFIFSFILYATQFLYACSEKQSNGNKSNHSQSIKKDSLVYHDTLIHDTFFIYRNEDPDWYQVDYICKEKEKCDDYEAILNFKLDTDDVKNLAYDHHYASDSMHWPIKKLNLSGIPRNWIKLVEYQKKYFLYNGYDKKMLTDSSLIFYTQEGYHSVVLQSLTSLKPNEYTIHFNGSIDGNIKNPTKGMINIYVLNATTKLSVWEKIEDGVAEYELRIPKESAKYYDLIDVKCMNIPDESMFQKVDFMKLIKESQSPKK